MKITEFAPGSALQGFTGLLLLPQIKPIALILDTSFINDECNDMIADAIRRKALVA